MEVESNTKKIKNYSASTEHKKCGMAEKSDLLAKACKVTFLYFIKLICNA